MSETFKLSEQAMVALLFLFQRSLYAAATGENENFLDRAKLLNFTVDDDGNLVCLNAPAVEAINVDRIQNDTSFVDLEDE